MIDPLVFLADSFSFKLQKHTWRESDKRYFKVVKPDSGSLPDLHGQLQTYFVLLCVYVCRVLPEISGA